VNTGATDEIPNGFSGPAAEKFYRWVLTHHVVALPSPARLLQLRRLLTPDFLHVLKEAEKAQDRCITNAQEDMKPDNHFSP
jgi:hypothetical protein